MAKAKKAKWIPYVLPWDDAPLDLSFLYESERPAGKHGFLTVKRDQFVFEDGTKVRFWGTLFNSAANFPSHEYSEIVAKRLGRFGVNIVRTHQMDAEWCAPNIFQCKKGRARKDSLSFDPESIDRLDYLIYSLKQEGIYIYLDQLSHRTFKAGDGVDAVDDLPQAGKPYACFDPRLIELQKKYSYDLWTHINPYTGVAYKDDPAVALMEISNENELFRHDVVLEPYRSRLEQMYRTWAEQNGVKVKSAPVEFVREKRTPEIRRFFHDTMLDYYREMTGYLRNIGVKVPITGTNWSTCLALLSVLGTTDYIDSHTYWRMWKGNTGSNEPLIAQDNQRMLNTLSHNRLHGKPFFVSEWDITWPNEWRAESPLMMASLASLQGWNGLTIHTYRYRSNHPVEGKLGGVVLDGVGYRLNFDTFNDPAKFGLFYHAALLFRKGHVKQAKNTIGIEITEDMITTWRLWARIDALKLTTEQSKTVMVLPGKKPKVDRLVPPDRAARKPSKGEVLSDTGELYRSWRKKVAWIDTDKTKAVYGFVGGQGKFKLKGMSIHVKTDFAVIAVSSLTDDPIEKSNNLLLTAVGRADNTGTKYNEDHTERLDMGHAPVVIEVIEAAISIETAIKDLKIYSISSEGHHTGCIDTVYEKGVLKFEIGKQFPSMYYLIQQ